MNDVLRIILLICGGLLAVFLLLLVFNHCSKRRGIVGEKRVAKVLRAYARKHRCKVWNNAFLPLYQESCEIDHLVFGTFGVAVIETKHLAGTISGSGDRLTQTLGRQVHTLRNPQLQNKTHTDNVRHHLRKAGLGEIPVHGIVVFSCADARVETTAGIPLEKLPQTLDRLHTPRGTDSMAAYRALRAVRVKSPVKKLRHDLSVRRRR